MPLVTVATQPVYGLSGRTAIACSQLVMATPGLIGYWRLNENTGTTAADRLGVRTLTAAGTVTVGQPGPFAGGGSFLFGGGYISGAALGAYSKLTVEAWVRTTVNDGARHAIYSDRGTGILFMTGPCIIGGGAAYNLVVEQDASSVAYGRGSVDSPLNDGLWHHIAGVIDGTVGSVARADFRLYTDGSEATYSDETYTGSYNWPSTPATFRIGQTTSNDKPWSGNIAEVAIYSRALTSAEIRTHANALRR